jgi:pantoate--beta-alanine ligase
MRIIEGVGAMQLASGEWLRDGRSVGFVATMGALHAGHISLVERARAENEVCVASVFVNPTQFGANEDLGRYPRPFERDRAMLEEAGCDVLFAPDALGMYGVASMEEWLRLSHATVEVSKLGEMWEGTVRPGHLRGVATVVTKLFNLVRPTRAYFGEKDFQQLRVLETLARDLFFPFEVVGVPTAREPDGLALSSRNAYLSPEERAAASVLFRAMSAGRTAGLAGERSVAALGRAMHGVLEQEPLVSLQYLAVVNGETLEPLEELGPLEAARILIAARVGATRLIDNVALA